MANISGFFRWIVDRLRFRRLGVSPRTRLLTFGAIYNGTYSNWKHDPKPTIWVQYSGEKYTHGINVNYLNTIDKMWLARVIYLMKKGNQSMDGYTFYKLLKVQRYSIVQRAYRVYFTSLLNMKLVSAGITPLDEMIYTTSKDPWIATLNEAIKPSEMRQPPIRIAYDSEELRNRIIQSQNAIDITKARTQPGGRFGLAPWLRKT